MPNTIGSHLEIYSYQKECRSYFVNDLYCVVDETDITEEPEVPPHEEPAEPVVEEEKIKKRQWYNMVTYGLPNLMVTQL